MNISEYRKLDIPTKPGIYFWKRGQEILYIGKATNLASRTSSYLQSRLMETRGPLIVKMIEDADALEWQETETALEALLLESHLIKKHQPSANSREKDDRSYNYVVITDETYPHLYPVRKRQLDRLEAAKQIKLKHVFGPFPQGNLLRMALKIIRKIFPFRGRPTKNAHADEFYKQLGLLPDTTQRKSAVEYQQTIEYIVRFFRGEKKTIIRDLKKQMKIYSDNHEFERAGVVRDRIYALEHIHDIALLRHDFEHKTREIRIEAYDIAHLQGDAMVGVMVVHNGNEIVSNEHRVFNIKGFDNANDTGALSETLSRRLKHPEWLYPDFIVVDGGIAQKRAMEGVLRDFNIRIPVIALVKDDKHKAKAILGQKNIVEVYSKQILAINAESHRFAINHHKKKRQKKFLNS